MKRKSALLRKKIAGIPELFLTPAAVQKIIDALEPGYYTAKEIFDYLWSYVGRPRQYGKDFKAMTEDGSLEGIQFIRKRSNKSLEYLIT